MADRVTRGELPTREEGIQRWGRPSALMRSRRFKSFLVWILVPFWLSACSAEVKRVVLTGKHKVVPDDGEPKDHFGISVAIDGDRVVVGAKGDDERGLQAGSAYVIVRGEKGWELDSKVVSADGGEGELFGKDVAIDGERMVVGSRGNIDSGYQSGLAYVFSKGGFGWVYEKKLAVSAEISNCCFGTSVSISDDAVIVGASGEWGQGCASGAAYIFRRTTLGLWLMEDKLIPRDAAERDYFGTSVDIDGDGVIEGAFGNAHSDSKSGSAYIFKSGTRGWALQAKLVAAKARKLQ